MRTSAPRVRSGLPRSTSMATGSEACRSERHRRTGGALWKPPHVVCPSTNPPPSWDPPPRVSPADNPRYVMGLGDTEGVLDAIERGADLFDCVWPTRLARHGRVLSAEGDFNLRRAEFATDDRPLSSSCGCSVCSTHTRAYLRHLLSVGEITALRLLSIHNLAYTLDLMAAARRAIGAQSREE